MASRFSHFLALGYWSDGSSSAALVLALGLLLSRRRGRRRSPGVLFAFGVGPSRVYLGGHFYYRKSTELAGSLPIS